MYGSTTGILSRLRRLLFSKKRTIRRKYKREDSSNRECRNEKRRATINMSKQRNISKEVKTQKTQHGAYV